MQPEEKTFILFASKNYTDQELVDFGAKHGMTVRAATPEEELKYRDACEAYCNANGEDMTNTKARMLIGAKNGCPIPGKQKESMDFVTKAMLATAQALGASSRDTPERLAKLEARNALRAEGEDRVAAARAERQAKADALRASRKERKAAKKAKKRGK